MSGSVKVRAGTVETAIDGVLQPGAKIEPPSKRRIAIGERREIRLERHTIAIGRERPVCGIEQSVGGTPKGDTVAPSILCQ